MQLSDQKVWDLSRTLFDSFQQELQQQKLDVDNLDEFKRTNIKPLYPHKVTPQGQLQKYTCSQSCCTVNPGYFCCCQTSKPDPSFRKLGLGMCLYFKFMKHSMGVLVLVTILAVLATLLCLWVANQNNFNVTQNYSTFLFSTTLGVFASEKGKCTYALITNNTGVNQLQFPYQVASNLDCPYGKVSYFGAAYSNQSSNSIYNCRVEIESINASMNLATPFSDPTTAFDNCTASSTSSCSVAMDLSSNQFGSKTVSFGYQCQSQVYTLGSQVSSSTLFYLIIASDLLISVIFLMFYISEVNAEKDEIRYFKCQQLSLKDFSLKIKGFTMSTHEEQLQRVIKVISSTLGGDCLQQIVQIKTPDRIDFIQYQIRKEEAYKELRDLIEQQFFENQLSPSQFRNLGDFIDNCFSTTKQYQKYKSKISKYTTQYLKTLYIPNFQADDRATGSVYFVFSNVRMKQRVYEMQEEKCFSRYLAVGRQKYTIVDPPAPDLIQWKNKGKNLLPRLVLSWLLTLAVCFGSYLLFAFIQLKQDELLSTYNFDINCNILFQNTQLTVFNNVLNTADVNYFSCFCQTNLFNFDNPDYDLCADWRVQYFTYLSIPIVISLLLVVYNVVVKFFFKLLTILEAHRLITDQLSSYTVKRAFLFIMNMGLIIILINTQYNTDPTTFNAQFNFLIQGKYKDITADWYINIGSIIILTLLFNVSFPLIELALASILKCIKRCWDKKCWCRKTSCKSKQAYVSLFSNDVYPIEQRYAFLIAIFIVCFVFSCIIPILWVICFISIFLLYLIDRVLVFKLYQTPLNYNADLHQLLRKSLYLGLVLHFGLTAVFLSEPLLVAENSTIPTSAQLDSNNSRINTILHTSYILPYLIMFLLLGGWALFDNTIIALFIKCALICRKNLSSVTKYKLSQDYYQSINYFQLAKLKRITQNQLSKLTVKTQNNVGLQIQMQTNFNQTIKNFKSGPRALSSHQEIIRRVLDKIRAEQTLRKRQENFSDVFLIGMPGYEIMLNDQVFDQNRRNIQLTDTLRRCLKDLAEKVQRQEEQQHSEK